MSEQKLHRSESEHRRGRERDRLYLGNPEDQPICPVCGGRLLPVRAKLQCERCHTICETCCDGGRQ